MKPAVLVDVDGVLNAFFTCHKPRETCRCHPGWTRLVARPPQGRYRLTLNPAHGPLLASLAEAHGADLVWASYWGPEANTWVSPTVGLPTDLEHVPIPPRFNAKHSLGEWKARHVADWAEGRPFVWFEDEQGVAEVLRDLAVGPHLVVAVDETVGLTDEHLDQARAWLTDLT